MKTHPDPGSERIDPHDYPIIALIITFLGLIIYRLLTSSL